MRLSTYTLVALLCAVFSGMMSSQAHAGLVFTGQSDPQIEDDFDGQPGTNLNATFADHETAAPIQWVADNDFQLANTDNGGVVRRALGGPGNSVAYLPYIYDPENSENKRATMAMEVFLGAGSDSVSLAMVNQNGAGGLSVDAGGGFDSGSGELWMDLYRTTGNMAAVRILKRKPVEGGDMVVSVLDTAGNLEFDISSPVTMELSWQVAHGHGEHQHDAAIAARVNNTDVFTGLDLPANAHESEDVWHLQNEIVGWEPNIEGYGFAFDGTGAEVMSFEAVPEPTSFAMMALAGLIGGVVTGRRRRS